jgi:hypothetical protein
MADGHGYVLAGEYPLADFEARDVADQRHGERERRPGEVAEVVTGSRNRMMNSIYAL